MLTRRRTFTLLLLCLPVTVAAEPPLPYLEVPPQRLEELPYREIPHSKELGPPLQEADFPITPVDRISDVSEDPKTVYREMATGDFDLEPMVEILPRSDSAMQLPPPTVVPADAPASLPVNTIPAQRVVEVEATGEERIFQELTAKAGAGNRANAVPRQAPTKPLRRMLGPAAGGDSPISVVEEAGAASQ